MAQPAPAQVAVMPVEPFPIPPTATVQHQPQSVVSKVLYFIECSEDGIGSTNVEVIEQKLKNQSGDILYLVLHTYGGDVYSAVRIMRIIQSKFTKIKVIIPDFAYSSGTVMSLGSDEINMAVDATLGPLDKPLEHPKDGSDISSLDVTQTLSNIASICSSTAEQIFANLRNPHAGSDHAVNMKLSKSEAAKLAYSTAAQIVSPIISKIDPFILQRGFREAKIGLFYAIDMLLSRMMVRDYRQALSTSRSLVNDFPSHGYGIFRDEARSTLKLTVNDLELLVEWELLEPTFNELKTQYSKYIEYTDLK